MTIKPINGWRSAWRWFSIQVPAVNLAFLGAWGALPTRFQDAIPLPWVIGIAAALIVLGVAGRLIDQTKKDAP